jgi:hypothetical protein
MISDFIHPITDQPNQCFLGFVVFFGFVLVFLCFLCFPPDCTVAAFGFANNGVGIDAPAEHPQLMDWDCGLRSFLHKRNK